MVEVVYFAMAWSPEASQQEKTLWAEQARNVKTESFKCVDELPDCYWREREVIEWKWRRRIIPSEEQFWWLGPCSRRPREVFTRRRMLVNDGERFNSKLLDRCWATWWSTSPITVSEYESNGCCWDLEKGWLYVAMSFKVRVDWTKLWNQQNRGAAKRGLAQGFSTLRQKKGPPGNSRLYLRQGKLQSTVIELTFNCQKSSTPTEEWIIKFQERGGGSFYTLAREKFRWYGA